MATTRLDSDTSVFARYLQIKHACPDALLFLRIGDFYEAFDEDAQVLQRNGIALAHPVMFFIGECVMAGVSAAAFPAIREELLAQGYRVAVAEDVPTPQEVKQPSLFESVL